MQVLFEKGFYSVMQVNMEYSDSFFLICLKQYEVWALKYAK